MYSVEDQFSFERLEDHVEEAEKYVNCDSEEFVWAVFASKSDLPREVEEDSILALCKRLRTNNHFHISTKLGLNVEAALKTVVKQVHQLRKGIPRRSSQGGSFTFRPNTARIPKEKRGCC